MIEANFLVDCLAADLFVILAVEGQVATKHQIGDDAKRPAVNTFIVGLLEEDLWCNIAKCSIRLATGLIRTKGA